MIMSPNRWEGDILYLVQILLALLMEFGVGFSLSFVQDISQTSWQIGVKFCVSIKLGHDEGLD